MPQGRATRGIILVAMGFSFFRRRDPAAAVGPEQALEQLRTAAFFAPTPWAVAREMLELAGVGSDDVVYDLGSGDGRIPIMAAQEFGARAVGIELDEKLRLHAEERVREYGLTGRVAFRSEDFFKADLPGELPSASRTSSRPTSGTPAW
jgi:hypothetical protein